MPQETQLFSSVRITSVLTPSTIDWQRVRQKFYHLASWAVVAAASCSSTPCWLISLAASVLRRATVASRSSPLAAGRSGWLAVAGTRRWLPWASISVRRSYSASQQPRQRWRRLGGVPNDWPVARLKHASHWPNKRFTPWHAIWRASDRRSRDSVRGEAWQCGSGEVVRAMSWRKFWNVKKCISKVP